MVKCRNVGVWWEETQNYLLSQSMSRTLKSPTLGSQNQHNQSLFTVYVYIVQWPLVTDALMHTRTVEH